MNNAEANQIIAEFMDMDWVLFEVSYTYFNSLDALVPVWEKLGIIEIVVNHLVKGGYEVQLNTKETVLASCDIDIFGQGETIQQAAAHATAKAILALRGLNL